MPLPLFTSTSARPRWLWMLLGLLFLVACGALIPRQGWDPSYGPVVPHDSFPADCLLCHNGSDWHTLKTDFQFDHRKETGVELRGAHASTSCLLCHNDRGPTQQFAAQGCSGCHQDPHRAQLGRDCSSCHDERTWRPQGQIARHQMTRMPLTGAHSAIACFRCHPGAQVGNFAGASPRCEDCHGSLALQVTAPDHVASGFTRDCQRCHRPISWLPAQFAHSAAFPLTLGHGNRRCAECHTTPGTYTGLSTDCASCHITDYNNTTVVPHAAAGIPTTCTQCHNTARWLGANFPHSAAFPLTNGHRIACNRCHTTPAVFTGLDTACVSCHQTEYNNTTVIPHAAANFSTDCTQCHTTTTWRNANYPHTTTFPLTGGHAISCSLCHTTPGVFAGLNPNCFSCHQTDYNNSTDPAHASYQFPQTCRDCHTTTAWRPANWTHRFPRTGNHNVACTECHTNPSNRAAFSCIDCHEHNQSSMDSKHRNRQGYSWTSAACLNCHPNGRG